MLNMTIGGRNYVYKPSTDKVLAAGKVNKLSITINGDPITIVNSELNKEVTWENQELTDNSPTVINNYILEGTEIGTSYSNPYSIPNGTWVLSTGLTDFSATGEVSDGIYTIDVTAVPTTSSELYKRTLFYKGSQNFDTTKKYKLTFDASSNDTNGKLRVYVFYPQSTSSNRTYSVDSDADVVYQDIAASTTTTNAEIVVNPSRLNSSMYGNNNTWSDNSDGKTFCLMFIFMGQNVAKYQISNVVLQAINNN